MKPFDEAANMIPRVDQLTHQKISSLIEKVNSWVHVIYQQDKWRIQ